ncbi:hypothetical protein MAUB_53950 [Mycolicibacterium aubagnense]|uniref:Uncharacterized protein n=1 Tax=Mycolicibacterium aubagnense TaxID=319707 RepID=A0ABM7ILC1_9MYCO|nr:hypothetical protein MAUB_53950 [Mycolicibacterium aubagnense]
MTPAATAVLRLRVRGRSLCHRGVGAGGGTTWMGGELKVVMSTSSTTTGGRRRVAPDPRDFGYKCPLVPTGFQANQNY